MVKYKMTPTTAAPMIAYFPGGSRSRILVLHYCTCASVYVIEGLLISFVSVLCTMQDYSWGDYGIKAHLDGIVHIIFHAL